MLTRFFILIIIWEIFCWSQEGYIFIREIEMHKLKENGKSWDSFGGNPDIQLHIFVFEEGIWKKKFTSTKHSDTYKIDKIIETKLKVYINSKLKIEIVDSDLGGNDLIGSVNISITKEDFFTESQQISFGRILNFVYFISEYETLEDKKYEEKIEEKISEYKKTINQSIEDYKSKIEEQQKLLEEQQKLLEKYKNEIKFLKQELKENKKKREEEFWNQFEEDTTKTGNK